jgi:uncharacterized RDD family membrane protein YckC
MWKAACRLSASGNTSVNSRKYILVRDGKPDGPYTIEELKSLSPRANDFVKAVGEDDYYEIQESRELSQLLSLSYQGTKPQYFAALDARLLAWGIDMFLSFGLYSIVVLLPVLTFAEQDARLLSVLFSLLSIPPIQIIACVFLESSRFQGTPGKLFLRIKVTDQHGQRISLSRSLVRSLAKLAGYITLGVAFFIGFFDKKQRCLHDHLAGTVVIKDRLTG